MNQANVAIALSWLGLALGAPFFSWLGRNWHDDVRALGYGLAGQLLLRTFGRAERIYQAVLCRGGEDPEFVNSRSVITGRGAAGGLLFCILVILFRCFNITMLAGQYARSLIP